MKRFLESCCFATARHYKTIFENQSLDTWQNIENFKKIILENKIDVGNIYVFADSFHSIRVSLLLKYHGFINIFKTHSYIKLDLREKIKEIILIVMTFIDPSGTKNPIIKRVLEKERKLRSSGNTYLKYS